jgi:hypothetical protein
MTWRRVAHIHTHHALSECDTLSSHPNRSHPESVSPRPSEHYHTFGELDFMRSRPDPARVRKKGGRPTDFRTNLQDLSESPLIRVASRVAPRGAKRRPKKILTSETSKTQEIARLRAHTHTYSQGQRGLS